MGYVYRFRRLLDLANAARNRKKQKDLMHYEEDKSKKSIEKENGEALERPQENGCTNPNFDVNALIDGLNEYTSLEEALIKTEHLLRQLHVPNFDDSDTPGTKYALNNEKQHAIPSYNIVHRQTWRNVSLIGMLHCWRAQRERRFLNYLSFIGTRRIHHLSKEITGLALHFLQQLL